MSQPAVPTAPIRILVRGSSTVSWIAAVEPGRVSHAYPRALEATLYRDGRPAQVRAVSPLAASSLRIMGGADDEIFAFDPDVVILNTGHMECLHMLLPRPFARHVFTRTARPGRWRDAYRRRVLWAVYTAATRAQARVEHLLEPLVFRRRRAAVVDHVNRYIDIAIRNGHPLVIVMGYLPPATPVAIFPGLVRRLESMNQAFRDLVAKRADPAVVWFDPADALAAEQLREQAIGDGLHFTRVAHEAVGRQLAAVVETWAGQQPAG